MTKETTHHTPGPWKVLPFYGNGGENLLGFEVIQEGNRDTSDRIAILKLSDAYRAEREITEANARLIAAAPETARERDEWRSQCQAAEAQRNELQNIQYNLSHALYDACAKLIQRLRSEGLSYPEIDKDEDIIALRAVINSPMCVLNEEDAAIDKAEGRG